MKNGFRFQKISSWLWILLAVAAGLRFYRLGEGPWLDEILTYVNYANLPFREIVTTFDSENQHFLYSILARASFLLFGSSVWALRLPAVLFGVGSIGSLYLFGRQVTSERESLMAAALLVFSYHHVWFSQNARGYTGLLFWALLSSWMLIRGLRSSALGWWLGYALAAALGAYTHLTMAFVIFGQGIAAFVMLQRRRFADLRQVAIGFGAATLFTAALYAPVISQISQTVGGSEASVVTAWKSPFWTALEIIQGLQLTFSGSLVAIGALLVFGVGLISYWRSEPLVVWLLVIPPAVGAGITVAIGHHLWPRFFFFTFGFGALVVIRGANEIGNVFATRLRLAKDGATWPGLALGGSLVLLSLMSVPFAFGPKQDYGAALAYVQENLRPGDTVVTVSLTTFPYQRYYQMNWVEVTSQAELDAIRANSKRTWLLYTFPPVLESIYPDIMGSIQADFELVSSFPGTVREGTVFVARSDSLDAAFQPGFHLLAR